MPKTKKRRFVVLVGFPAAWYWDRPEVEKAIIKTAKQFKIRETGAGMGFGQRDLDFDTADESQIKPFFAALRKLYPRKLNLQFYEDDED